MKELLYIHPAGQSFSFLFGLFNFISGHTRRGFNRAIHLNCGLLYYFSTFLGAGLGLIISKWAVKENYIMSLMLHEYLAMVIVMLFLMGATTGFTLMKQSRINERILKYHKITNGLSLILFLILGVSGFYEIIML